MDISSNNEKQAYDDRIEGLLADIQDSYDAGRVDQDVHDLQRRLDAIAADSQHDESLGQARFKLYAAQAYLHYFRHENDQAQIFIRKAVRLRGGEFQGSVQLEHLLGGGTAAGTMQPIRGWLIVFMAGLGLGIIYNGYQFFSALSSFSLLNALLDSLYPGLLALLVAEQIAFALAIILSVTVLLLIFFRKRIARIVCISFFTASIIWMITDYTLASHMFANSSAATSAIQAASSTDIRFAVIDIVWMLYIIFSKRVKATLVR